MVGHPALTARQRSFGLRRRRSRLLGPRAPGAAARERRAGRDLRCRGLPGRSRKSRRHDRCGVAFPRPLTTGPDRARGLAPRIRYRSLTGVQVGIRLVQRAMNTQRKYFRAGIFGRSAANRCPPKAAVALLGGFSRAWPSTRHAARVPYYQADGAARAVRLAAARASGRRLPQRPPFAAHLVRRATHRLLWGAQ